MIRYRLQCENEHQFETWFPHSGSFETQVQRGLVRCPHCESRTVRKALMSPAVLKVPLGGKVGLDGAHGVAARESGVEGRSPPLRGASARPPTQTAMAKVPEVADLFSDSAKMRQEINRFWRNLKENADDVGTAFAKVARQRHEDRSKGKPAHRRAVYGRATVEEFADLEDDGVPVMSIPMPPRSLN